MMDGSIRVGLAGAGAVIGSGIGALLFGPAGAWVLGAASPVLFQSQTRRAEAYFCDHVPWQRRRQWEDEAHGAIDVLQTAAIRGLRRKREQLARKLASLPTNDAGRYLRWRLIDDGRFTRECEQRIAATVRDEANQPEQRFTETIRWMDFSCLHAVVYQKELREADEVLKRRPGLAQMAEDSGARDVPGSVRDAAGRSVKGAADWVERTGITKRAWDTYDRFRGGGSND